jgi:hypothetical protein
VTCDWGEGADFGARSTVMRLRRAHSKPKSELLTRPECALRLHLGHAHSGARDAHERRRSRGAERGRKGLRLLGLRLLQRVLLLVESLLCLLELECLHLLELRLRGVRAGHALQLHCPLLLRRLH